MREENQCDVGEKKNHFLRDKACHIFLAQKYHLFKSCLLGCSHVRSLWNEEYPTAVHLQKSCFTAP